MRLRGYLDIAVGLALLATALVALTYPFKGFEWTTVEYPFVFSSFPFALMALSWFIVSIPELPSKIASRARGKEKFLSLVSIIPAAVGLGILLTFNLGSVGLPNVNPEGLQSAIFLVA